MSTDIRKQVPFVSLSGSSILGLYRLCQCCRLSPVKALTLLGSVVIMGTAAAQLYFWVFVLRLNIEVKQISVRVGASDTTHTHTHTDRVCVPVCLDLCW